MKTFKRLAIIFVVGFVILTIGDHVPELWRDTYHYTAGFAFGLVLGTFFDA